jgi:hypothetical protein
MPAKNKEQDAPERPIDLLLWFRNGLLSSVHAESDVRASMELSVTVVRDMASP